MKGTKGMKKLGACVLAACMLAAAPCGVHAERNCGGAGMPQVNFRDGADNFQRGSDFIEELYEQAADNKEAKEIANACAEAYDEIRRAITTFTFSFDLFNFDYEKILNEAAQFVARKLEEYCRTAIQSAKGKIKSAAMEYYNKGKGEVEQKIHMSIPDDGNLNLDQMSRNLKLPTSLP